MYIKFKKYQGAGNDFIIIDNRILCSNFPYPLVEALCDRKFGIGADGLMLLEEDEHYDFRMRYFNADGKEASMCGNGGRCIAAYAHRLGLFENSCHFLAMDGAHSATVNGNTVNLKMTDVDGVISTEKYFYLNTGSPHYVKVVADCRNYDVVNRGREIRYSEAFQPDGTNVNFITPEKDIIHVRTYERGVEDETLACGTGCVASALCVALLNGDIRNTYTIDAQGGQLKVSFERQGHAFRGIWLEGPATFVFDGEIDTDNLPVKTEK